LVRDDPHETENVVTAEEILEKVRSHPRLVVVEDFELVVEKGTRLARRFENGTLRLDEREEFTWASLRLVHRRQPGRAVLAVESPDTIPLLIESAFTASRLTSPDPWFRFPLWRNLPDTSQSSDLEEGAIPTLRSSYDPALFKAVDVEEIYEQIASRRWLFRKTEKKQPRASHHFARARLRLRKDGISRAYDLSAKDNIVAIVQGFEASLSSVPWSGEAPRQILFRPDAVAAMLPDLAAEFYGDRVLDGAGNLGMPREERIFDEKVTLIDDGAFVGAEQSWPFDLEGTPTQETRVVEQGRFKAMLLDAHAAARDNKLSTGNFVKSSPWDWPKIGPTNFFVQNGKATEADLLAVMIDGAVVETAEKDKAGQWWGRGRRVSRGAVHGAVHEIPLPATLRSALRSRVEIGNDLSFHRGWGSPSILCADLPLSNE